jgi:hypothetical protein
MTQSNSIAQAMYESLAAGEDWPFTGVLLASGLTADGTAVVIDGCFQ